MIKIEFAPGTLREMENLMRSTRAFETKVQDRSEVLKKAKRRQIQRWQQNFSSEGGIYGTWPALSPRTVANRISLGFKGPGPKLVRTGRLMSWVKDANKNTKDSNQAIQWNFAWSGGRDGSVAALHSEGYQNVPQRLIWDLNAQDRKDLEVMVDEWVDKIIAKYFG